MNKKSFRTEVVLLCGLFAYLLFANTIVSFIVNQQNPIQRIRNFEKRKSEAVYFGVDLVEYQDDIFEKISFSGWAFCETEGSNEDRLVEIILESDKNVYAVDATLSKRDDIVSNFSSSHMIKDGLMGVVAEFSTVNVKNGDYRIWLYVKENDEDYGVIDTGYRFSKKGRYMEESTNKAVTLDSEPVIDETARFAIDSIVLENNEIAVNGWGIHPEVVSSTGEIYLCIKNNDRVSYYPAVQYARKDIANVFGEDFIYAGCKTILPVEDLGAGTLALSFVIQEGNTIYETDECFEYALLTDGETLRLSTDLSELDANTVTDTDSKKSEENFQEPEGGEEGFSIVDIVAIPLSALMMFCYKLLGNYGLTILVFTFLSKIILLPVSLWVQKNGITMVRITPEVNRIKIKYFGDKDSIDDETQALYKREKYNPLASTVPMIVQIVMLLGVIGAVKNLLSGADSVLTLVPSEAGGATYLMPLAAGLAALALGLAQNKLNPLQREQGKKEQWMSNGFSIAISLFLGAFVSLGVGIYWVASNLLSILQQVVLNILMKPEKYIDYEELERSKTELAGLNGLSAEVSKEDKKREQDDYKKFFSVANKHLVIYSEKSGFYKYYKDVIDFMLEYSNVIIHYVTNDPKDQIFRIAETQPRIKPYYISEKKLITLLMKMDADIVVMTCPDLDRYHLKRSYVRKDIEYVYMFHYPLSTHMVLNNGALDHYDTILCVGDFQFEEIRAAERLYNLPEKKLISAGYGQLEQLYSSYQKMEKINREKPKILIAPSWQQDNILDSCIDALLEQLLGKGYELVIRPHPEYVKRYKPRMDSIVQRYAGHSDLTFELDFTSNNSLFDSDILISDWSGSAYEFSLVTLKPAVFVNTPPKINNPEYDKLNVEPLEFKLRGEVGIQVDPADLSGLAEKINALLKNSGLYEDRIRQIRDKYIAHFGRSGEIGGKYILSQLLERQNKKQ